MAEQGNLFVNFVKKMRNSALGNALMGQDPSAYTIPSTEGVEFDAVQGNPSVQAPFQPGKGFSGTGYAYSPEGQLLKQSVAGGEFAPFVGDAAKAQRQLARAGMPAFQQGQPMALPASSIPASPAMPVGGDSLPVTPQERAAAGEGGTLANFMNKPDTQKTVGAVAAALKARQDNKFKLTQAQASNAGSPIQAGDYLMDLYKASALPNRGGK